MALASGDKGRGLSGGKGGMALGSGSGGGLPRQGVRLPSEVRGGGLPIGAGNGVAGRFDVPPGLGLCGLLPFRFGDGGGEACLRR